MEVFQDADIRRQRLRHDAVKTMENKSTYLEDNFFNALDYAREIFNTAPFIKRVYYHLHEENGVCRFTIIHDVENRADALESIYDEMRKIEDKYNGMEFNHIYYHEDEFSMHSR